MAIIPNDEQFVGVSSSVDMTERKSSRLNNNTQVYTLQDFKDSVGSDGSLQIEGGVALDGTLRKVADQGGNLSPLQLSTGGTNASGSGTNSTQLGVDASATGVDAIAIGRDSNAGQNDAIAIGR